MFTIFEEKNSMEEIRFGLKYNNDIILKPVFIFLDIENEFLVLNIARTLKIQLDCLSLIDIVEEEELKDVTFYKENKQYSISHTVRYDSGVKVSDYIIGDELIASFNLRQLTSTMFIDLWLQIRHALKEYTTEHNVNGGVYFDLFFLKSLSNYRTPLF